ncbi:MAG: helix-turn-helix domain-containing protein [Roseitalea porphyridii]|uniref:TetR/AcrR family transcriptional regulator n=1 Tax=Roseitalea porphyridii TaxID=1852022 RepID=UPI0032D984CC
MLHICSNDKRGTVLLAALDVFITYGFRKTSMDDIARAAGMSRPALYQSFKNKTEIFRALAEALMSEAARNARSGFAVPGCFRDKLRAAMERSILEMHRFVEQTAHGQELIGISDEIASDISKIWTDSLTGVIAEGLAGAERDGLADLSRFGADAKTIARVFVFALEGLKEEVKKGKPIETHMHAIIEFFADAVELKADTRPAAVG